MRNRGEKSDDLIFNLICIRCDLELKRDEALFVQRFGFDRVAAFVVERDPIDKRIDKTPQQAIARRDSLNSRATLAASYCRVCKGSG